MPARLPLLLLSVLILSSAPARATDVVFKRAGQPVKTLPLAELHKNGPRRTVTVMEPHDGAQRRYVAIVLASLLDGVYSPDWRQADELLLTCADGYQPSIPTSKLQAFTAYLAMGSGDGKPFKVPDTNHGNALVDLGPLYLVWDNLRHPELVAEGMADWPYQVVSIDLISFQERFPALAPPAGSSEAARRGFLAFRKECLMCHTINGQGGGKGPELNQPVNITEYFDPVWLRRWLDDPRQVRSNAAMPPLNRGIKERERVLDDLVAYLKAMKQNKK